MHYGAAVQGDLAANIAPLHLAVDQQISQAVQQAQHDQTFNPKEWDVTLCWFLHKKGDRPY